MRDLVKYVELRTKFDKLVEIMDNHDKTCQTCIKSVECAEISLIQDKLDEIGIEIDKL